LERSSMRITESRMRRIIREEIIREQGVAGAGAYLYDAYKDYTGEASAQGLSTAGKVAYAGSRGALDATPLAARQVAQGNVGFDFTTYWGLNDAQKRVVTDSLGTISSSASALALVFPPAAVIPVATGIVSAALKAFDGDLAGGARDLLGSILVGLLATGKLAALLTNKLGAPIANLIGKDPRKFLRAVMGDGASLMPEVRQALAKLGGATDLKAAIAAGYKGSAMARGAGILLRGAVGSLFSEINGTIATILTQAGRSLGAALAPQYQSAKTQVLTFLENPAGLTTALAKSEKIFPGTA
jgi:hypothetical protein